MAGMDTADIVVVGLGAMGAATLHRLALRGVRAVGIDRLDPPHDQGSTHGESRITRLAVAEGEAYVPLVQRSHAIWRELEAETGETLFLQNGGIVIGRGDGAPSHGTTGFLGRTIEIARAHAIPHTLLDSAEIRRRFPHFRVDEGERAYFEPSAGIVFPERCVAVQLRLAQASGAVIRPNETMLRLETRPQTVIVHTDKGRIEAARVVLTAGAWLPALVGGPLQRNTRVQRQTLLWFHADEPALYDPAHCPWFIWMHGTGPEDYLYGFPILEPGSGVKAATERYGADIDPNHVDRTVPEQEWRGMYARHVAGRLRGVTDRLTRAATCLYTTTPDAGFVLDHASPDGRVIAASACSGHGFKHSPAIGEHLAALATGDAALAPGFQLARF